MREFEPGDAQGAVALRLAELRKAAGMSRDDLATAIGVDLSLLARMERGEKNLTLATLVRLAFALRTTVSDLVSTVTADDLAVARLDGISKRRGRNPTAS